MPHKDLLETPSLLHDEMQDGSMLSSPSEQRKALTDALYECQERFRILGENLFNWEMWLAPEGDVEFVSPACERVCGYTPEHFYRQDNFLEGIILADDVSIWKQLNTMVRNGARKGEADFRVRTPQGKERWINCHMRRVENELGTFVGFRTVCRDITDSKMLSTQLKYQAWHDSLTSLPNRALCMDRMDRVLTRAKRIGNAEFAVLFLDLDRFKVINDSLGQNVGDQILQQYAARLAEFTRSMDTVSRIGGDEFVVLLEDIFEESVAKVATKLCAQLEKPFTVAGRTVKLTSSVGVVIGNTDYESADTLLRNANIAMHAARDEGWGNIRFFKDTMLAKAIQLMDIEMDLHRALEKNEFHLVYQPIVNLRTKQIKGFEALIRWDHPERGIVAPSDFIPVSENTGQILSIGSWVLKEACAMLAEWRQMFPEFHNLMMSINLSAAQLSQPGMVEQVAAALQENALPGNALKLEVTETMLMHNPEYANVSLKRLKELGVQLCIDDFGTGYSSLSYLQAFPIDTLKVDKSFVARMSREPGHFKIVQAVVALAHSLGLEVIAEGVEEEEQRIMLSELRCEGAQGYLFSCPLEASLVPELILGNTAVCYSETAV